MIVLIAIRSAVAEAEEQTVVLAIDNMTCALCPVTVRKAIERVEGVKNVSVGYGAKRATVRYDDAVTSLDKVANASTNAGFPASKTQ